MDKNYNYFWLNGELVEYHNATVHLLTHSLHYSGAVFEGERAYNGQIFKLDEHIARLLYSAKAMRLNVNYSFDEIKKAHAELMSKNNIINAYIRPLIWRGSESMNLVNDVISVNMSILAVRTLENPVGKPLNLITSKFIKPSPDAIDPQVKSSTHYGMNIVAKMQALDLGFDDALLLDARGYIAEATTANIFFVNDRNIITPKSWGFLRGITRDTIINIALDLGYNVIEDDMSLEDISNYQEAFVTGTAIEIRGINSITTNDKKVVFCHNNLVKVLLKEYHKRCNYII